MDNEIINKEVSIKIVPLPVKILAVLSYVSAALTLLSGIILFVASNTMMKIMGQFSPLFQSFGSFFIIVLGIIAILMAILNFFIGKGLWSGKNWARIFVVVVSVLGILGSFGSIMNGDLYKFIPLVIYVCVGVYLLYNKSVKEFFKKV